MTQCHGVKLHYKQIFSWTLAPTTLIENILKITCILHGKWRWRSWQRRYTRCIMLSLSLLAEKGHPMHYALSWQRRDTQCIMLSWQRRDTQCILLSLGREGTPNECIMLSLVVTQKGGQIQNAQVTTFSIPYREWPPYRQSCLNCYPNLYDQWWWWWCSQFPLNNVVPPVYPLN